MRKRISKDWWTYYVKKRQADKKTSIRQMTSKHTPGPWGILSRTNNQFYIQPNICDHVRTKANARLIAASPLLLEACKETYLILIAMWGNKCEGEAKKHLNTLKQAIAHAKGEEVER